MFENLIRIITIKKILLVGFSLVAMFILIGCTSIEVGTINYKDGHIYEGEIKRKLMIFRVPYGQGKYTWEEEISINYELKLMVNSYKGEWKNGFKHGKGTMIRLGDKYIGEWKYSFKQGYGTLIHSPLHRSIYEEANIIHKIKYEGEWHEGSPHGRGVITYSDGSIYKGEINNGLRHGQGVMIYIDGSKYKGEWEYDIMQGEKNIAKIPS